MTVARSVARAVASPVARAVVSGNSGSGTDADAAAYFAAVEGAGGSFDLSGINAAYTPTYIKAAISAFVAGLKSDGVWSLLDEYYLFCAKDWAGREVKLKGSGSLVFTGFAIGDWFPTTGLQSNTGIKRVETGFTPNSSEDISYGGYIHTKNTVAGRYYMGQGAPGSGGQGVGSETTAGNFRVYRANISSDTPGHQVGSFAYTRRGTNDHELYSRGVSIWTDATVFLDSENEFIIGHFFNLYHNGRVSLAWMGRGISTAIALAIATREQELLTAIGGNAY